MAKKAPSKPREVYRFSDTHRTLLPSKLRVGFRHLPDSTSLESPNFQLYSLVAPGLATSNNSY